ncbi:hypothetical protein EVAR_63018_1 [Eumeta japonica]|uniref:Uncharacterized protein n=1 Tax=Eumeta variegata TaxID=151549 RepID=A0A4C1YRY4_EUMVA|nr:hypothetical protein EVAR_63018_1 [Eumeta japonica]
MNIRTIQVVIRDHPVVVISVLTPYWVEIGFLTEGANGATGLMKRIIERDRGGSGPPESSFTGWKALHAIIVTENAPKTYLPRATPLARISRYTRKPYANVGETRAVAVGDTRLRVAPSARTPVTS